MNEHSSGCCPRCGFPEQFLADLLAPILARALAEVLGHVSLLQPSAPGDMTGSPGVAVHTDPSGGGDGSGSENSADANTAREPSTEPAAPTPVKRGNEGPAQKKGQGESARPAGGGRADNTAAVDRTRKRLVAWLESRNLTVGSARHQKIDLGASPPALYDLMRPAARTRPATLVRINAALDRLEKTPAPPRVRKPTDRIRNGTLFRKTEKPGKKVQLGEYDESQVEVLPTKWKPDTGVNPLPIYDPPPRCGRTS